MYGFEGVGLSEVQLSISELSVVGGWVGGGGGAQTHFMVGPSQGPTIKRCKENLLLLFILFCSDPNFFGFLLIFVEFYHFLFFWRSPGNISTKT